VKRLFVGNLSFNSREHDVRSLFEQYGTVGQVQLVTDRDSGQSRGFAFVDMPVDSEAEAAINGLNGYELDGRALNVNEARDRDAGGRGGYGGGGGAGNRSGGRSRGGRRDRY
jgi:RNA recognition motif-containing protein